ncbi:hypothetical protein HZA75_00900 [Candidatus Roizmanbacteria bacterium]|nr:hypothetical protein [Candidatus Roizmanbacteria bacterium]
MKLFLRIVKAFLAEQYFLLSYPVAKWFVQNIPYQAKNYKATIVFVECWFQKNPYHRKWSTYMEENGYRTILLHFSNMNESFEDTAKRLRDQLESMDLKNYTLVGISSGAVLCLYYLNHYHKWRDMHRFVSVGGPLKGTKLAWAIAFTKKGKDLVPNSHFLQKLLSHDFPKEKMTTISAEVDELVPLSSTTLPEVESYVLPVDGHNVFHLSFKKTYDLIAKLSE